MFRRWCKRYDHTLSRPTVWKTTDSLVHLRREDALSTSSIKVYKLCLMVFCYLWSRTNLGPVGGIYCQGMLFPSTQTHWGPSTFVDLGCDAPIPVQGSFVPPRFFSTRDLARKTLFLLALVPAPRMVKFLVSPSGLAGKGLISGSAVYLSSWPRQIREFTAHPRISVLRPSLPSWFLPLRNFSCVLLERYAMIYSELLQTQGPGIFFLPFNALLNQCQGQRSVTSSGMPPGLHMRRSPTLLATGLSKPLISVALLPLCFCGCSIPSFLTTAC